MLCPRQKSFKDAQPSTAFSLNLLLHVTKFETLMSIDSFFIEQATFAAHLFIVPGDLLLSRSIVPKCNIKLLGCPCEGFQCQERFSSYLKIIEILGDFTTLHRFHHVVPKDNYSFLSFSLFILLIYILVLKRFIRFIAIINIENRTSIIILLCNYHHCYWSQNFYYLLLLFSEFLLLLLVLIMLLLVLLLL